VAAKGFHLSLPQKIFHEFSRLKGGYKGTCPRNGFHFYHQAPGETCTMRKLKEVFERQVPIAKWDGLIGFLISEMNNTDSIREFFCNRQNILPNGQELSRIQKDIGPLTYILRQLEFDIHLAG
jgi:hypothetical protein